MQKKQNKTNFSLQRFKIVIFLLTAVNLKIIQFRSCLKCINIRYEKKCALSFCENHRSLWKLDAWPAIAYSAIACFRCHKLLALLVFLLFQIASTVISWLASTKMQLFLGGLCELLSDYAKIMRRNCCFLGSLMRRLCRLLYRFRFFYFGELLGVSMNDRF